VALEYGSHGCAVPLPDSEYPLAQGALPRDYLAQQHVGRAQPALFEYVIALSPLCGERLVQKLKHAEFPLNRRYKV
jgi:hypothetical protein